MSLNSRRPLSLKRRIAIYIGIKLYRVTYKSLKIVCLDEQGNPFDKETFSRNAIFVGWHGNQAIAPLFLGFMGVTFLASTSKDGETFARAVEAFGGKVVRGSSTREGVRGMVNLVRLLKEGKPIAMSPDAPRGPRCIAKDGVAFVSLKSYTPIIPISVYAAKKIVFQKSWDKFWLPLPFSRTIVIIGSPIEPKSFSNTPKNNRVELLRKHVQDTLNYLDELARLHSMKSR